MHFPHCGVSCKPYESFYLEPRPSRVDQFREEVLNFVYCPQCQKQFFRSYGVQHNGERTPPRKVSNNELRDEWLGRVEKATAESTPDPRDYCFRFFVSQWTEILKTDPANDYTRREVLRRA